MHTLIPRCWKSQCSRRILLAHKFNLEYKKRPGHTYGASGLGADKSRRVLRRILVHRRLVVKTSRRRRAVVRPPRSRRRAGWNRGRPGRHRRRSAAAKRNNWASAAPCCPSAGSWFRASFALLFWSTWLIGGTFPKYLIILLTLRQVFFIE